MIEISVSIQESFAQSYSLFWECLTGKIVRKQGYVQPENLFVLEALRQACQPYKGSESLCEVFYDHGMTILQKIDHLDYIEIVKQPKKWYKSIVLTLSQCSFYAHVDLPGDVRKEWLQKLPNVSTQQIIDTKKVSTV